MRLSLHSCLAAACSYTRFNDLRPSQMKLKNPLCTVAKVGALLLSAVIVDFVDLQLVRVPMFYCNIFVNCGANSYRASFLGSIATSTRFFYCDENNPLVILNPNSRVPLFAFFQELVKLSPVVKRTPRSEIPVPTWTPLPTDHFSILFVFASKLVCRGHSCRGSQLCHTDMAGISSSFRGLRAAWQVAVVRSLARRCDRNPKIGQTRE